MAGIVGYNSNSLQNSFNIGNVNSVNGSGICGINTNDSLINNCYNYSNANSGIANENLGTIINVYNITDTDTLLSQDLLDTLNLNADSIEGAREWKVSKGKRCVPVGYPAFVYENYYKVTIADCDNATITASTSEGIIESGTEVEEGTNITVNVNVNHGYELYFLDYNDYNEIVNGQTITVNEDVRINADVRKIQNIVYFHKPASWTKCWIYIYDYHTGTVINIEDWGGLDMEYVGGDLYRYIIPDTFDYPQVLFSNGGDNRTQIPARMVPGFYVEGTMIYDETIHNLIPYVPEDIDLYIKSFESDRSLVQPVGREINFTSKASGGKDGYSYEFAVNGEVVSSVDNTMSWTPTEVGTYEVSVKATDRRGDTATKTIIYEIKDKSEFEAKIIYKGVNTPNIYYKLDGGSWIVRPGIKMIESNLIEGYYEYTVELEEADQKVILCFNDGKNNWDSINGKNYTVTAGEYVIHNTNIYEVNSLSENTTTIFYKGYENPYIHYCIENSKWTTPPGIKMKKSETMEDYYEMTIDLGIFTDVYVTFNNGSGNWQNNGGQNYAFGTGKYIFENGVITELN